MNCYLPVVNIIGCGFAGIECALFLAGHGIKVHVFQMHRDYRCNCDRCTGKVLSEKEQFWQGLLKRELSFLGSPLIREEDRLSREGYGGCLASKLLEYGENLVKKSENIEYFEAGISEINPREINIIATGSNTDEKMFDFLTRKFGSMRCFRHLQVNPVIDNIDTSLLYRRKGDEGHLFLPLEYDEYLNFVNAIIKELNRLEISLDYKFCQSTIEDLACKGRDALKNYAMMPRYIDGLKEKPYALICLKENKKGYSIEGFSSKLSAQSQLEILKSLKAFENITLLKAGDVENAVYINSKYVINDYNQSLQDHNLFFAGSILGLSSYYDCIASGLYTAMNVFKYYSGKKMVLLPSTSLIGSLSKKVINSSLLKRNVNSENYDILQQEDYSSLTVIERLFNRSVESLKHFKEEYTNGKYV